jgi:hypothetical protein
MTPSEIFKSAHRLTRSVVRAGENYRASFGIALRSAYLAIKAAVAPPVERIVASGSLWSRGGRRRVYFNDLPEIVGIDVTYQNGKVAAARFGRTILDIEYATAIVGYLKAATLWFDLDTAKWESRGLDQDYRNGLIAGIYASA